MGQTEEKELLDQEEKEQKERTTRGDLKISWWLKWLKKNAKKKLMDKDNTKSGLQEKTRGSATTEDFEMLYDNAC